MCDISLERKRGQQGLGSTDDKPRGSEESRSEDKPFRWSRSHCLLCLRRVVSRQEPSNSKAKRKRVEEQEATASDFLFGELPSLLLTLEWAWWSLARNVKDVREAVGQTLEKGKPVRFLRMPTLCETCGETLRELDRMLHGIREQVAKLKILTVEAKARSEELKSKFCGSGGGKVEGMATFQFLEVIWNAEPDHSEGERREESTGDLEEVEELPALKEEPLAGSSDEGEAEWKDPSEEDEDHVKCEEDESGDGSLSDASQQSYTDQVSEDQTWTSSTPRRSKREPKIQKKKAKDPQPRPTSKAATAQCRVCGKRINNANFRGHMKSQHNLDEGVPPEQYKIFHACDLCKVKVHNTELLSHVKGHVGSEYVLRCVNPECNVACVTIPRLLQHYKKRKNNRELGHLINFSQEIAEFKRKLYHCPECSFIAEEGQSWRNLHAHLQKWHEETATTEEKKFPCPISGCEAAFRVRQSLVYHLSFHKDLPGILEEQLCLKCQIQVKLQDMEYHLKEKHGATEVFRCPHCPFLYSSREEMVYHLYVHRNRNELFCDICGKEAGGYTLHAYLARHYFNEHQIGREWSCDPCGKIFYTEKSLHDHKIRLCHGSGQAANEKSTFQCEDCGQVWESEVRLRGHKIKEHGAESFSCNLCCETFSSNNAAFEHERVVHKGFKRREFSCPEPNCGAVFRAKGSLKKHHKEVHLGQKGDHVCEECGKGFWTAGTLRTHQEKDHLGVRKHVCEECGEAFGTRQVLRNHKMIHTGERRFACELCGQRFRYKEVMNRHIKGHETKGDNFKPSGPMKQIRRRVVPKGRKNCS